MIQGRDVLRDVAWRLIAVPLLLILASVASARRPNVVLIMADDMGFESLGCNGGTSYDSARLDELAARGMRFTHCYSQPICTPSRNKIMTGRSNARNYRSFGLLAPEEVTFGNVMNQAGYETCIAGKWQLTGGGRGGATPQSCGFQESCMWAYRHNLPTGVEHTGGWEKPGVTTSRYWHPSIIQNGKYRPTKPNDYGPDIYTQFIIDFISHHQDDEFFVYFPMTLTHGPFLPTPHSSDVTTANKFKSHPRYFGEMISYTGYCVNRIVSALEKLGIAEETLVIFTADNGTHRSLTSRLDDRIVPGGKGLTLDAGCHVPMIAYWPGKISGGTTCTDLVDFSDFLPTLAELGHAALPTDRELDGRSFLPQLVGQPGDPRAEIFVHYDKSPDKPQTEFRRVRFAFDGRYKLYHDGQLFDVPRDWGEDDPIDLATATEEAKSARSTLQRVLDSMPPWTPDNTSLGDEPDKSTKAWRRKAAATTAD